MKTVTFKRFIIIVISIFMVLHSANAQSKLSLNPGLFYNGTGFTENIKGLGLIMGLEYMQSKNKVFSIELRTKYGYYAFDDGTKWRTDNNGNVLPPKNLEEAQLEYILFSPQIGIVPKLHLRFDEVLSLFIENEFAGGLIIGDFKYKGFDKKRNFTESIFCYNLGVGGEYKLKKYILTGSISYSTLNFRSKIKKHQPAGYEEWIPNQNAAILINIILKIPLK